jgi:hypothetical protein
MLDEQLTSAVVAATGQARVEALASGVPVFYRDADGLDIMEEPDGRKFEIRLIPGAPRERIFEIVRELVPATA